MRDINSIKQYTKSNMEAWEQVASIHYKHNQSQLIESFSKSGFTSLDAIETKLLKTLGVVGKDVAQICCNNGKELLSVKNMGAARCVGFDGAQNFINHAQELAQSGGLDVEFVCTDIYDIGDEYAVSFDLVTITIGVLCWMPNLNDVFAVVAKLIKPGGALFIYEQHPIIEMFEPGETGDPIVWELSYFDKEPYIDTNGLDYFGGEKYKAKPATSFLHTMSEVIMAGVNNGLKVEHFEELPHHISNTWWNLEGANVGLPMCYTLILRK